MSDPRIVVFEKNSALVQAKEEGFPISLSNQALRPNVQQTLNALTEQGVAIVMMHSASGGSGSRPDFSSVQLEVCYGMGLAKVDFAIFSLGWGRNLHAIAAFGTMKMGLKAKHPKEIDRQQGMLSWLLKVHESLEY